MGWCDKNDKIHWINELYDKMLTSVDGREAND